MEVILLEDVQGKGERGQKVNVSPGYARNYLIPNKLAINAAGSGAKVFAEVQRQQQARDGKNRTAAEDVARKLSGTKVLISVEVGEEDRLFGSVTNADIAEKLASLGFDVDKRKIHLEEPIKQLGTYSVSVKLFRDVEGMIKVSVEKK